MAEPVDTVDATDEVAPVEPVAEGAQDAADAGQEQSAASDAAADTAHEGSTPAMRGGRGNLHRGMGRLFRGKAKGRRIVMALAVVVVMTLVASIPSFLMMRRSMKMHRRFLQRAMGGGAASIFMKAMREKQIDGDHVVFRMHKDDVERIEDVMDMGNELGSGRRHRGGHGRGCCGKGRKGRGAWRIGGRGGCPKCGGRGKCRCGGRGRGRGWGWGWGRRGRRGGRRHWNAHEDESFEDPVEVTVADNLDTVGKKMAEASDVAATKEEL